MERSNKVAQIIHAAIDEVNSTLSPKQVLKKSPDTVIIGGPGALDSLGTINFVVALEEKVERTFRQTISLMDAITAGNTPWTIAALGKRVEEQLDGFEGDHGSAQPSGRRSSASLQ